MAGAVTTSLNLFQSKVHVQFQIYTNVYPCIDSPHQYLVQPHAIIDFKVLFSPFFTQFLDFPIFLSIGQTNKCCQAYPFHNSKEKLLVNADQDH